MYLARAAPKFVGLNPFLCNSAGLYDNQCFYSPFHDHKAVVASQAEASNLKSVVSILASTKQRRIAGTLFLSTENFSQLCGLRRCTLCRFSSERS
jgi:hypothetical protein